MTQEELAERSGLTVRAIGDMERGRTARPYPRSVRQLADALDLTDAARAQLTAAARARNGGASEPEPADPDGSLSPMQRPVVVPRQLPPAVRHFAGRSNEIKLLNGLLAQLGGPGGAVVIGAIAGTAGVGKSALATYWAHRVAGRFPDGQLYVNLRGFDPRGVPVTPGEAIRGFLDALDVPPARIPASHQAQVGLYRSMLAGRRMLILLDNARDTQQVRPLLPASPDCLALVTSRSQLTGLVVTEGAQPLTLDVLTEPDAYLLLSEFLGPQRVSSAQESATALVRACAGLPLALAIAAARAATHDSLPLASLAAELRDSAQRLDALEGGDPFTSVRAVLSWSYQLLSEPAARMFRLLGAHPGPDISGAAAASLAGICAHQASRLLDELASFHLLTESSAGRHAFHDLLRAYAVEQSAVTDCPAVRQAAKHRMLDFYLYTAYRAEQLIKPDTEPITLTTRQPGVTLDEIPDQRAAMAWFRAEHQVLHSAVSQAAGDGFDSHAWQIPCTMATFLNRLGHWEEWVATQRIALSAAQRRGEATGQALARLSLGRAFEVLGRHEDSKAQLRQALRIYRQLGDDAGQATTHIACAQTFYSLGRTRAALSHAEQALTHFKLAGHRVGQATALNSLGWDLAVLGNYQQALAYCEQALDLCRQTGIRSCEGATWDSLGYIHHHLGHHDQAIECYQRALRIFADLDHRRMQGRVLTNLGDAHQSFGEPVAARYAWKKAAAILDGLRSPDGERIGTRLRHSSLHLGVDRTPRAVMRLTPTHSAPAAP